MRPALPLLLLAALGGCAPAPSPTGAKAPAAPPQLHAFAFFVSDLQARDPRVVEIISPTAAWSRWPGCPAFRSTIR